MPKFEKEILKSGIHVVTDHDGNRRAVFIPESRIEHWAKQHKEMVAAGLNIPAPAFHDESAVPTNERLGSKSNYGFWEQLTVSDTVDEQGNTIKALHGVLDAPVESDAEKIGKSVKETSVYSTAEFVDGAGRIWKDVLTHISPCVKPIEPGQKNFKPMKEGDLAIAMSHRLPVQMNMDEVDQMFGQDGFQTDSSNLYGLLKNVADICIPEDTPVDRLHDALVAALLQKQQSEKNRNGGTVNAPPKNSELHEVPVVMANQQQPKSEPTVEPTPVVDDAVVMSHPAVQQIQNQNQGLTNLLNSQKQNELKTRLAALRKRGVIGTDDLLNQYAGQVDAVQMSFDSNQNIVVSPIEHTIAALENVVIPMPENAPQIAMATQTPEGFVVQPQVVPSSDQVDDSRADDIVNQLMGTTNA